MKTTLTKDQRATLAKWFADRVEIDSSSEVLDIEVSPQRVDHNKVSSIAEQTQIAINGLWLWKDGTWQRYPEERGGE